MNFNWFAILILVEVVYIVYGSQNGTKSGVSYKTKRYIIVANKDNSNDDIYKDRFGGGRIMAAPEIDSADGIEVGGILLKDGAIKDICVGSPTELTISSGSVTITQSYHTIDTEGDDATDDLVTILGGTTGRVVIIRPVSTIRTVVVKNNSGANNISCGSDFIMEHNRDNMVIMFDSDLGLWIQLSRSDNS